ncbi:MAG: AraC family transcriptional regulator [Oscillospiraceae bacterium]|nr:AraC family transcriptional regulator [Oscillospiraceae bacterium]
MDYKYDIISFDNKIPATLKVENIDSKTRKTELLWHREPELVYVMSGKAECVINGEEQTLDKGEFVLLNSEDVHLARPLEDSSCSLLFVIFSLEYIKQFKNAVDGLLFDIDSVSGIKERVGGLLGKIADSYGNNSAYVSMLQIAYVNQIYYLLLEHCVCYRRLPNSSGIPKRDFSYAKTAISYINENYSREITLDEISSIVNLSPSYFSKHFKKVTQTSFSEYLANLRLEKAIRDMLDNNTSVSAAALKNGFANVKSFITQCKKVYNCTPAQYKKRITEKNVKVKTH